MGGGAGPQAPRKSASAERCLHWVVHPGLTGYSQVDTLNPQYEFVNFGRKDPGFRVQGSGFRVQGSGFRVWGGAVPRGLQTTGLAASVRYAARGFGV